MRHWAFLRICCSLYLTIIDSATLSMTDSILLNRFLKLQVLFILSATLVLISCRTLLFLKRRRQYFLGLYLTGQVTPLLYHLLFFIFIIIKIKKTIDLSLGHWGFDARNGSSSLKLICSPWLIHVNWVHLVRLVAAAHASTECPLRGHK
jgi:hypothetical protein